MSQIERIRRTVFKTSQVAFGAVAGVSQAAVSRWENGESEPTREELRRIREEAFRLGLPWSDSWFFEDAGSSLRLPKAS